MMFHDIGKFSKSFQALVPELFKQFFPDNKVKVYEFRHDTLGFVLWRGNSQNDVNSISKFVNNKNSVFGPIINEIVKSGFGHHGYPPEESAQSGNAQILLSTYFDESDIIAAQEFAGDCLTILGAIPEIPEITKQLKMNLKHISWNIAGLGVIADWIGSNDEFFSYTSEKIQLQEYWCKCALPKAEEALKKLDLKNKKTRNYSGIPSLFPFIIEPTPLQTLSEKIPFFSGPKLFIVEDVTGSGKTEAATILAARIMSVGEADGLYIGLPTMATANAMYGRMAEAYRKLYDETAHPSLILSHGSRHLSKKFTETIALHEQRLDIQCGEEETASAFCNQWFADNRKKALLADVGVGTIDQALTGILPAKHQSLRLFGLQRKILIVDEVHAYDPYMEHLLSVLLEAHARGGGSAILLSATIPRYKKEELVKAFQKGLGIDGPEQKNFDQIGFPLLTQVGKNNVIVEKVATRKEVERSVGIEFLHDYKAVLSTIVQKSKTGECICWIRNTVKDARKAFYDLKCQGVNPDRIDLFHSRFAMIDRARIEEGVIGNFGKKSGEIERQGRILIATQVVEQSLDLDFDIMISDLAPVDLLIQRAGRLHRHIRDKKGNIKNATDSTDERQTPILYIHSPVFTDKPDTVWLSGDFAGTAAVYRNTGILWRTQRLLEEMKGWKMPDDARELIESVYDEKSKLDVPDGLMNKVIKAENADKIKESMGHLNALVLEKGYCRAAVKADQWDEDDRIPTRLSEENKEITLAVMVDGELLPYANVERYPWDWSTLSLSLWNWKECNYVIPKEYLPLVEALKKENTRLKYNEIVFVSQKSDKAFALKKPISENYDPRLGWGAAFTEEDK
jgi:CRISPR-associated endonuclease/helicase Cas3